jgi:tRNA pseudouridine55 synthase
MGNERLFVAYKPPFLSSNRFLGELKRKYGVKKGGFSGTLDPFAEGVLLVAFGRYTKLFQFLAKTPKKYRATLLLGGVSSSLDIEKVEKIEPLPPFSLSKIEESFAHFTPGYLQLPPIYSAKRVKGVRAYRLAEMGQKPPLEPVPVEVKGIKLLDYSHPFLTIEAEVGEGCYIRSLGRDIAEKLGTTAFLTSLKRLQEGKFVYECEKPLNPVDYLPFPQNFYTGAVEELLSGKPLPLSRLQFQTPGKYWLPVGEEFFSIIQITPQFKVKYLLNLLPFPKLK